MSIKEMNGNVPENIEAIIERKGLKKKAIAEKVGITAQDLSGLLAGRRLMKIREIRLFADALGVSPNDLVQPLNAER